MTNEKLLHATFAPMIPVLPQKQFSKLRVTENELKGIWQIIGPSATRNIDRLPLWKVIATAYIEGLHHGSGLQKEKIEAA